MTDMLDGLRVVDILLETTDQRPVAVIAESLASDGWRLMAASPGPTFRLDLNHGYTPDGFADQVFHLHIVRPGDTDELYFRDWLRQFRATQSDYATLKRELAFLYKYNRDAYTDGKTDFIRTVTAQARVLYGDRWA